MQGCQVCRDQGMSESFLCNLVRQSSSEKSFTCHTFRPNLSLVGKKKLGSSQIAVCQGKEDYFADVVRQIGSGGCGSGGTCGSGLCGAGQDAKGSCRKFHAVWVVRGRRSLFSKSSQYVSFLHDVFLSCGHLMSGKVLLVWLAPDHLHLYLENDGKEAMADIMEDMQGLVHDALVQEFPGLKKEYGNSVIWESSFFMEEIS